MARRGRPQIGIRLHPAALEILQARATAAHGRRGGVAALIRRYVYERIGFDSGEHDALEGEDEPDTGQ